jgi:hypothetical protein
LHRRICEEGALFLNEVNMFNAVFMERDPPPYRAGIQFLDAQFPMVPGIDVAGAVKVVNTNA